MRRVLYLFGEFEDNDIDWLGTTGQVVTLAAGEGLIAAGTPPDRLAIVLDGMLAVRRPDAEATELARLYEGEIVGELTFLDPRPPLVSVTALETSQVLQISHEAIAARLARDDRFAVRFYRGLGVFLASRLRRTTGLLGVAIDPRHDAPYAEADELDDDAMERSSLASRRFELLLARLGVN